MPAPRTIPPDIAAAMLRVANAKTRYVQAHAWASAFPDESTKITLFDTHVAVTLAVTEANALISAYNAAAK